MAVRLFVGNLPYDASEDEIRQHFSTVGNLSYVSIPLDRETGRKRGFAFVEFADAQQAQEAIRQFNNQPFKGRALAVNEARAKEAGPRPSLPRPMAPPMRAPAPDFSDPGAAERDRPARKNFGPDSKPGNEH
jgi:RNA recognition motif-containing protein